MSSKEYNLNKILLSTLCLLYANFSFASLSCKSVFEDPLFLGSLSFREFEGYPRKSSIVAEILGYPVSWSYRKLGGDFSDIIYGEKVSGGSALSYVAEKPDGTFLVIKQYTYDESPTRDMNGFVILREVLGDLNIPVKIPWVQQSVRAEFTLEIEYFKGIDLQRFIELNQNNPKIQRVIFAYNRYLKKIQKALGTGSLSADNTRAQSLNLWVNELESLSLRAENILVVRNQSQPDRMEFVVIDPE